ncbi:MAG: hypothetical protein J5835_07680, partial [Bacteroidales bacterium]|nr:hypothetical protein [Bacteroidales bacterium]
MKREKKSVLDYRQVLERIVEPDHSSTIHVQLPSYRDCELKNTILALRGMAANPERVHIAVCCQGDDPETLKWLDGVPDLTYRYYTEADAPGTCRARYDCNRMLRDEDYVLHLDSHMRFAKHWDLMLIDQLARCHDERAILTGYCQSYNEYLTEPWDAEAFTERTLCAAIIQTIGGYYGEGITPFLRAIHDRNTGGEPVPGAMVSAHFLFAPARLDREVPFDPCMYFVGDELPMALRYFTHGWNVYHPGICCVWHLYDRAKVLQKHGQPFDWPDCAEPRRLLKLWVEKQRILKLYGMEENDQNLTGCNLGGIRTLQEFEEYAGI